MAKRLIFLALGVLVVTLTVSSVALAATPQEIYDDFAKDGKLDGHYSQAELQAFLNNATLRQYADPTVMNRLDSVINQTLTRDTFPFTGFQLLMAGVVAVVLIGGGIGLRRLARSNRSS